MNEQPENEQSELDSLLGQFEDMPDDKDFSFIPLFERELIAEYERRREQQARADKLAEQMMAETAERLELLRIFTIRISWLTFMILLSNLLTHYLAR